MRLARVAVLAALALGFAVLLGGFAGPAHAGDVSMVVRDLPLGPRSLAAVQAPIRFDMVGLHWEGGGAVLFRTRTLAGRWTPWTTADDDAQPDVRSAEHKAMGPWHDGAPVWTGASDRIQFRTRGRVTRLRAYYLWSRVDARPVRTTAMTGQPAIVSRFDWGANEQIVRAKPQYAPKLKLAIVHHTVNANDYTRAQAPAIVRGIETYHVKGNGWNDIGYNFLIDRYGRIYEGRAGGIDKNVIGAHSMGFNTGSVGVALIGTFDRAAPTKAQQDALVQLLAWRLDVAHIDPLSFVATRSLGNPRFHAGAPVTLRAISGHRDTYFTDCPGAVLYGRLPAIARAVSQTGLPKIYAPATKAVAPEAVRFTATLSAASPWTVTVTDRTGATVATGKGSGTKVDWTWSGVTSQPGPYGWSIQSAGARPATGSLGGPAPPAAPLVSGLAAPPLVSPAADGSGASANVTFALGAPAQVDAQLYDAGNTSVATLLNAQLDAGQQNVDLEAGALPDGRYRLVVTATPVGGGTTATASTTVVVDRTLTGLALSAPGLSPNGDGVQDTVSVSFSLTAAVPIQVTVQKDGATVATLADGQLGPGPQTLSWNGMDDAGTPQPDGSYQILVAFTDAQGAVSTALPVALDTVAPVLTLTDATHLRFTLSEPATVNLVVNGAAETKVEPAGAFSVPPPQAGVQTVTAQAVDAGGNVSAAVSGSGSAPAQ